MTGFALLLFLVLPPADPDALIAEGRMEEARAALQTELSAASTDEARAVLCDRIGETYLLEGRWWQAESSFAKSLDHKETGRARYHRGRAFFEAGMEAYADGTSPRAEILALMNDAARELRRAVDLLPGDVDALVALALAERYREDTDAEVAALEKALKLKPGHPAASIHLAWRRNAQDDRKAAKEILLAVAEADRTADHWKRLGRLAAAEGAESEAAGHFTAAALADPNDREAYDGLWKVTAFRKRFGEVNAALGRILEKHESAHWARYYLGFSRLDDGKPKEAVAEFERAAALKPDFMDARLMVAQVCRERQLDPEKGLRVFLSVLEADPENARARTAVAEIAFAFARGGNHGEAGRLFEALIVAEPSNPFHRMNLALTFKERGEFERALATYEAAEKEFPFEPQIPNDRGLLLMGAGRRAEAMAAFETALDRDDEFLDTLENLGAYARLEGDHEAALEWFSKALARVRREGGDPSKFRRYLDLVKGEMPARR
ncbi:MAG: tetratricopeptide repeat protein [Planctomycetota bacterium]